MKCWYFMNQTKSWRDFLLPLSVPTGNVKERVQENFQCYYMNYLLIFLVMSTPQPETAFPTLFLILLWLIFIVKNESNGDFSVGRFKIGKTPRLVAALLIAAALLLFIWGVVFPMSVLRAMPVVLIHCVLHSVPPHPVDESNKDM